MISRRAVLGGLIAAPAVVQFASLMPVRGVIMPATGGWISGSAEVVFVGEGWIKDWCPAKSYEPGQVVKTIREAMMVVKEGGSIYCHSTHVEHMQGRSLSISTEQSVTFHNAHFRFDS